MNTIIDNWITMIDNIFPEIIHKQAIHEQRTTMHTKGRKHNFWCCCSAVALSMRLLLLLVTSLLAAHLQAKQRNPHKGVSVKHWWYTKHHSYIIHIGSDHIHRPELLQVRTDIPSTLGGILMVSRRQINICGNKINTLLLGSPWRAPEAHQGGLERFLFKQLKQE